MYIYILVIKSRIVSGYFSDSTCKPSILPLPSQANLHPQQFACSGKSNILSDDAWKSRSVHHVVFKCDH